MKKCLFICGFLILFLLALESTAVPPEWVLNGTEICTESYYQDRCQITGDGFGGAIIVWQDHRIPSGPARYNIYAQRIDAYGHIIWLEDGEVVCDATEDQVKPQLCSDGSGGAIMAWEDHRYGSKDIVCARIDATGNVLWTTLICTSFDNQSWVRIIADGDGGAIMAWSDFRGPDGDIYAQKVDANGTYQWMINGELVCGAAEDQHLPELVSDGLGGAIICWDDDRHNTGTAIYAQRLYYDGAPDWSADGNIVCWPGDGSGIRGNAHPVSDGHGGAIIAFHDSRTFVDYDIYVQRIGIDGYKDWAADGVAVCTADSDQVFPEIVSDGIGGAIIAWEDERGSDHDIYAQRVSYIGTILWGTNGKVICNAANDQIKPQITTDGNGGCIITWEDGRNGNIDIYAQKFDIDGNANWGTNGKSVCSYSPEDQIQPSICPDTHGGAIIAWNDYREATSDYLDVYAQRVEQYGNWGYPCPTINYVTDRGNDQGGYVGIEWMKSRLDQGTIFNPIDNYSVWRMLSQEQTASLLARGEKGTDISIICETKHKPIYLFQEVNGTVYGWEWLDDVVADGSSLYYYAAATLYDSTDATDGIHHFKIIAHSSFRFWESEPDSGYSVDNLAPEQPKGTQAEQSMDPEGLKLKWNSNTETDLSLYRIYRGEETGALLNGRSMNLDPEILLGTTTDTTYFDDEWRWYMCYYYKITAVDLHGNESPPDSIGCGEITGGETQDLPLANYLDQNYPNPFNPITTIPYGLLKPADVSLKIYNVAGQLMRVLVMAPRGPGHYKEVWDGRDGKGRLAASGVYFYRLKAGDFEQTRKMILTR